VVWHHSLPLMNSFNKTEAAVFSCRLCFLRAFPFISFILHCNYCKQKSGMCVYACVCTCVHYFIQSTCAFFLVILSDIYYKTIPVLLRTKLCLPPLRCRLNSLKSIICQDFQLNCWHVYSGTDRLYAPFPV